MKTYKCSRELLDRFKAKRRERLSNGLCASCGKPLDRKGWHCKACLAKYNKIKLSDKHSYKEQGLCSSCHKPLDKPGWLCKECRDIANAKARERTKYRKEHGLCVQCGEQSNGYYYCDACRAVKNNRYWDAKNGVVPKKKKTGKKSDIA